MAQPVGALLTDDEYIAEERQSPTKRQFIHGVVVAMAGGTACHNAISANLIRELSSQLRSKPCVVLTSDQRVWIETTGLYTYPDVTVVCDRARFHPKYGDTLVNPTVIIEVLSRGTEAYDRGAKFAHYRRVASLKEYVVVSQRRHRVEHHRRVDNDQWLFTEYEGVDSVANLPALAVNLALRDIYEKTEGLAGDPEAPEPAGELHDP